MTVQRNRFPTALLLPALCLVALVWAGPLIYSLLLSLTSATPGRSGAFIGWSNFLRAFSDLHFRQSLWIGFLFAGGAMFLTVLLGLILALSLRQHPKLRAFVQLFLVLPWLLSELAVALIWYAFLDEQSGWVNLALRHLGLAGLPWRTSPFWAMCSLWIAVLWQGLAFSEMFQSSSLSTLPENRISAAKLDGASRALIFTDIIWPHQGPAVAANAFLVFILSLANFALPFALTGGGPLFATETATLFAYRTAFGGGFELGYAAAQGLLLLIIAAVLIVLSWHFYRRPA